MALSLGLAALVTVSAGMGYLKIPAGDVIRIMAAGISGHEGLLADVNDLFPVVVNEVRLPRILTAATVGAGLAACGTVFQGILLNPLADPFTLGVSAGAAFGASLALLFNITFLGAWTVTGFAFAGAMATLAVVIYLSASAGGFASNNLILSGVIVAAILSAGISLFKYLADEQVSVIIFWLMGSFAAKTWAEFLLTLSVVAAGTAVFVVFARDLNLLSLGERAASSLGVNTRRTPLLLLITASLIAAVCVSVSGIIGFVGLLVPHMVRTVCGPDNRRLVPLSLLAGAILLLAADTVTRAVLPHEVPIGVLTALIGGPVFCWIFRHRQSRRMW